MVLLLGLAVGPSQAAKPKKAKTEAEIEGQRFFVGNISEIFGDVHSKKSKCEKGRTVTLTYVGPNPPSDPVIGTDTTDATGDWAVDTSGPVLPGVGPYVVEVGRKKFGGGQKKLICKRATSPEHTFEEL